MLEILVPISPEGWDEEKQQFVEPKYKALQLEHSLVSVSKWESKWHKSFLSRKDKTSEEIMDYIKCMTLTKNVDQEIYNNLSMDNISSINEYIENPMTATFFSEDNSGKKNNDVITSELIYYWMITLQIPVEFEKWHLNRLLTLIRVCEVKNQPPKKMSRSQVMSRNAALNAARRKKYNSKG